MQETKCVSICEDGYFQNGTVCQRNFRLKTVRLRRQLLDLLQQQQLLAVLPALFAPGHHLRNSVRTQLFQKRLHLLA